MKSSSDSPMTFKKHEGLFASRPTIYIFVILGVILITSVYKFRTDTIFACQADGYNGDRYIAYCNGAHYGDYEHGAFLFGLEPSAQNFAKNADVLFLGNSRLQVAFSTTATVDWFSAVLARYYLLGFSYGENVIFAEELLRKILPKGRVYIINVDDFFERTETPPVKTVFHDPDARDRYKGKRFWQRIHEPICKRFPVLCGTDIVIFRSRETGAYIRRTPKQIINTVSYDWGVDENVVSSNVAAATDFLLHLTVERKCVILTNVPSVETKIGNITTIAKALGADLVTPEISTELHTYDGVHLDQPSAEHWSQAFFQAANSRIRSCLNQQGAALQ
jgi:hypothetical protein